MFVMAKSLSLHKQFGLVEFGQQFKSPHQQHLIKSPPTEDDLFEGWEGHWQEVSYSDREDAYGEEEWTCC